MFYAANSGCPSALMDVMLSHGVDINGVDAWVSWLLVAVNIYVLVPPLTSPHSLAWLPVGKLSVSVLWPKAATGISYTDVTMRLD